MIKIFVRSAAILSLILITGACANYRVTASPPPTPVNSILIRHNPEVVDSFEPMLARSLTKQGMPTSVIAGNAIPKDSYVMDYSASRSWDMAMFVSLIDLKVTRNGHQIADAHYDAGGVGGRGGWDFGKFDDTSVKLDRLSADLVAKLRANKP